jgi:hypothetical protein
VVRTQGNEEQTALPLFQVPVLKYRDKLELSFAGEAFDQRVTSADWSLIVVFLPRTIAPTDQGVVDYQLKHKDVLQFLETFADRPQGREFASPRPGRQPQQAILCGLPGPDPGSQNQPPGSYGTSGRWGPQLRPYGCSPWAWASSFPSCWARSLS